MADDDLLIELREYLDAQNVARRPDAAGSDPPLWLEPRSGVPAPGEGSGTGVGATVVLGAFLNSGIPPESYESFQRQDIVEFWIRTTTAPAAKTVERQLRSRLQDKRQWQMSGMLVIESNLWRPLQLITSDVQAFTYTLAFWFQTYFQGA